MGTAVKSGLGGNTSKLENLLPFVLLGVEIFNDQEVFEFMMSTIESEDDLWMWVDYVAMLIGVNGGLIDDDAVASNIQLPSALSMMPVA